MAVLVLNTLRCAVLDIPKISRVTGNYLHALVHLFVVVIHFPLQHRCHSLSFSTSLVSKPTKHLLSAVFTGQGTKAVEAKAAQVAVTTPTPTDSQFVTSGGRVLAVTGTGDNFADALDAAYRGAALVKFTPCHFRTDIGHRARTAPLMIGVLASGRGTALQAVIDAIEAGEVNARVALVVTNKREAPVRERAAKHGIPEIFISPKVKMQPECFVQDGCLYERDIWHKSETMKHGSVNSSDSSTSSTSSSNAKPINTNDIKTEPCVCG